MTTPTPPEPGIEAQSPDANGWLPIESAPKDGTEILGFWQYVYPSDTAPTVGYRVISWEYWPIADRAGWVDGDGLVSAVNVYTHFQRLPTPPVSSSANSSPAAVTKADAGLLPPASATHSKGAA